MTRSSEPSKKRRPTAAEARAEYEATRAANKAARAAEMDSIYEGGIPGRWILVGSWLCTALFAAVTLPAVLDPDRFIGLFFTVSVVLFFLGCAVFVVDIALAAARSRDDLMGIGGLFLLIGSAPRVVQVSLLSAMAAQIVVSIVGAASHPFTPLAFGTLVPILGLAACGLWAVRHGSFPPQPPRAVPTPTRPRRTAAGARASGGASDAPSSTP